VSQAARCPLDLSPADVAAWAADGEPVDDVEMPAHVATCPACQAVVAAVAGSDAVGLVLRHAGPAAPVAVSERAAGRIRIERTAAALAAAMVDAGARVASAAVDYLVLRHRRDE
jgi:hypothetical protein